MRLLNLCFLVSIFLSIYLTAFAFEVKVEAGKTPRNHTPVWIQIDNAPSMDVVITHEGVKQQGQVETLPGEGAKIWWMVDSLPANQSKIYDIAFNQKISFPAFSWSSIPQQSMDLSFGDKTLLRYINRPYDPENIEETKKPFHHVFDPSGKHLLTKGIGGKYSHHRGIFVGYKVYIGGEVVDIWHARNGEHSAHRKMLHDAVGAVFGEQSVLIDWKDTKSETFIEETRTLRAYQPDESQYIVELWTELKSLKGHIRLDGDRQHAGVQFRAAQEVAEHENTTRFLRPQMWSQLKTDEANNAEDYLDLPWDAMQFTVENQRYTVAYLTGPKNPDGARISERAYGRFGEFIPYEITESKPLLLHYQWWIHTGDDVTRDAVEARYQDMAGPPQVTIISK